MTDAENKPSEGEQPPEDTPTSNEASSTEAGSSLPAPRKTIQGMGALRSPSTPGRGLSLSERLRKISVPASADSEASSDEPDADSSDSDDLEVEPILENDAPEESDENALAPAEDEVPSTIEMLPEDLDDLDAAEDAEAGDAPSKTESPALGANSGAPSPPRSTMLSHAVEGNDPTEEGEVQTSAPDIGDFAKARAASSLAEPTNPEAPVEGTIEEAFPDEATEIAPSLLDSSSSLASAEPFAGEATEIAPSLQAPPPSEDLQGERTEIAQSIFATANEAPPPVDRSNISMEIAAADSGQFESTQISSVEELARGDRARAGIEADAEHAASGDFAAQATEVFSSPFEADPVCPRIATLSGPTVGQEFLVNRIRSTVGRGTDNSIVVPDLSMSRKHFEIIQQHDDSFMVRDLMSINGTALNGVKVREADLFHGDRLEAGQSTFQFVIPGGQPTESRQRRLIPAASTQTATALKPGQLNSSQPVVAPRRLDRILVGVTIGAAILCLPLIGLIVHLALSPDDPAVAEAAAPADSSNARALYLEGVDAIKSREWDRAGELFEQAAIANPEFGEVDAQLERIATERRAQATIERAREQVDAIDRALLAELGAISRESVYHSEAQSLIRLARQGEVHGIFERAQRAFENEDWVASREAAEDLLSIAPQHEGAQGLLEDLDAIEASEKAEQAEQAERDAEVRAQGQPRRRPSARPAPERDKPELDNPFASPPSGAGAASPGSNSGSAAINFTEGFNLYRDENFDGAIAHFESINAASRGAIGDRAARTAADVRTFKENIRQGEQALEAGDFDRALTLIHGARKADESIAGGRGYFEQRTSTAMAHALAGQGQEALSGDSYARAYSLLTRAQALSRSEPTTRRLALALEDEANSLYILAAGQRASDPQAAAELCRTILTMVPPSSDSHSRARTMLDELR